MKIKLMFVFMAFIVLLTACGNEPSVPSDETTAAVEREYVSEDITYSESMAQYAFRINMDVTETEHAKYYFEQNIDDREREACIEVTEMVLANQSMKSIIPEFYIFSQERYDYRSISENKLYSSVRDWKTLEYITDVLLVGYGGSAHYGTAFGYANYLAESYGWNGYEGRFSIPSVSDIFDLSYLCFREGFATSDDLTVAKEIACDFVDSFIEQNGEQIFQQTLSSCSESLDALAAYYKENGVSYIPSAVRYGSGGKSYDYIVYSDYGTFYMEKDWVDMHAEYNPLITDGFLHSNYADTKLFFETNLRQMKQYQDLFKLDGYNHDLDIVFSKPISASKSSFYQSATHRIYLYNVDSLMHEYIHALTMPTSSMKNWQIEGFARYFSYYYDDYGIAFLNQDYNNTPDTATMKWVHEYLATLDRPIDMAQDYCELENIAVYFFGFTDPNADYVVGSSFVQYLLKQYGEAAVIDHIYGNADPLPKNYSELVKEWKEYIQSTYKEYSKYKADLE